VLKIAWSLVKPLWDRISARITLHGQRYTLLDVQFTERLYREIMDELLYLDLANQRVNRALSTMLESCTCLDSACKARVLAQLEAPIPIGVGTLRSDDVEKAESELCSSGVENGRD
jgi:hypothetical protein